jgi:hypothetical protein
MAAVPTGHRARFDAHRIDASLSLLSPDGKHFLYLARSSGAGAGRSPTVFVGEIGSSERTPVLEVASNVVYASGHLLYIREGVLVAQKFNPKTFAVSGAAVPLVEDPRWDERFSRAVYSVSDNGVLVCMTGRTRRAPSCSGSTQRRA